MTREEIKEDLHYKLQFGTFKPNEFVDAIFDYFEKKCIVIPKNEIGVNEYSEKLENKKDIKYQKLK